MNWCHTDNGGAVSLAGTRDPENDAMCGVHVMYDVDKIFSAGRVQFYCKSPGLSVAHLIEISDVGVPAAVERIVDMHQARAFANVVVLPDGKALITGGQGWAEGFTNKASIFTPELFDQVTKTFKGLAPKAIPRNYHSISILLPDGTVFVGGGLCWDNGTGGPSQHCRDTVDHPNGQIFTTPYLLTGAPRSVIQNVVSANVAPGGQLHVTMEGTVEGVSFSLIRIGSVTHSINSDQRRVTLQDTVNGQSGVLPITND